MSALGQEQTCAAQPMMSAKGQNGEFAIKAQLSDDPNLLARRGRRRLLQWQFIMIKLHNSLSVFK